MSRQIPTNTAAPARDRLGRPLKTLRLSVTDRCNLRCSYCMPEAEYQWLPRSEILDFDEISQLVDMFCKLGVERVRLTGGEPLLRRDLPSLVAMLAAKPAVRDLALTTNGVLLAEQAQSLRDAGLQRLTVSLDTLGEESFHALTRVNELDRVLQGIEKAHSVSFTELKLDSVIVRGVNDHEVIDLLTFSHRIDTEIRFIEYMDVGGATQWTPGAVVRRDELLQQIEGVHGPATPIGTRGSSPAEQFKLPNGMRFGIIASTTEPFCGHCDRSRITADGHWYHCLYAMAGIDLKKALRSEDPQTALPQLILAGWQSRANRGAEQRAALVDRSALVPVSALRKQPHLEMHTRGG